MKTLTHHYDICVVGGGLSGMCASIAAARHGAKVALVHDRPVFGGNASSEIRMWPLGAHGSNRRETGIFEELVLENMRVNPMRTYPNWDAVLYSAVYEQDNLDCFMNCTVNELQTENGKITEITGWQLTTYTTHKITADLFIDCSGDSILAQLSGAEYRKGREARSEFNEEAAPLEADSCTMGNSLMIQVRETNQPVTFTPPRWIRKLTEEDLKTRGHDLGNFRATNFWWLELGGERNTLDDCEDIKHELLALSYGAWDHIKNTEGHNSENWELDWAGYLPGKRESVRCIGDHILTQNEVAVRTHYDDIIAYGGWKVDDHPPKGFNHDGEPTKYFDSQSPFGIPYRCIYSKNIDNLMFAGRNISVTHAAMAASRVMATCAIIGQAAGTAASLAIRYGISPREVGAHMDELQQTLMTDDCWLPGLRRRISDICQNAALSANCKQAENLRNGHDRPTDENGDNGCYLPLGEIAEYTLAKPAYVESVRLVFDSDLDRATITGGIESVKDCPTICNRSADMTPFEFPTTMTDTFEILVDGEVLHRITGNRQRLVTLPIGKTAGRIALRPIKTTGTAGTAHVFSFDFQ